MRKNYFGMMSLMLVALTACESNSLDESEYTNADGSYSASGKTTITFAVEGDMQFAGFAEGMNDGDDVSASRRAPMTRAAVTADGKQMTDLWLLDYVDGQLVQQLHQSTEDADFGTPSMALDYGQHHIYFVCSRGKMPELDTNSKTITWGTPSDTFWKDLELNVTTATTNSQSVTLQRVATRISVSITDAIPEGVSTITVTPSTWYYGLNYVTAAPAGTHVSTPFSLAIPASKIGQTNVGISIFGISTATEWTTDVRLAALDSDGNTLGQASISGAPFMANRTTSYSGQLFSSGSTFSLSLSAAWDEAVSGSW